MNFESALAAMRRGEKVRRAGWPFSRWNGLFLFDKSIHTQYLENGEPYELGAVKCEDIMATDWEIVPAEVKQPCTKEHEFNGA